MTIVDKLQLKGNDSLSYLSSNFSKTEYNLVEIKDDH